MVIVTMRTLAHWNHRFDKGEIIATEPYESDKNTKCHNRYGH